MNRSESRYLGEKVLGRLSNKLWKYQFNQTPELYILELEQD